MKKINIAIDGYSSCGKSTLAKELARELNYIYVDTGAMYRAVTLFAIENGFVADGKVDREKLTEHLSDIRISFAQADNGEQHTFLNGKDVTEAIRSMQVASLVSRVAEIAEVRKYLVGLQKEMARNKGVVMDGRDIGTVVIPDAELKIFMTASDSVRAKRRFDEMKSKGLNPTFDEVMKNLKERDHIDETREESPLRRAADARILDNTSLSRDEQFDKAFKWAKALTG